MTKAKTKGPWVAGWRDPNHDGVPPWERVWISMNPVAMGARAVKIALKDVGYAEGPGNNENKFGKRWGEDGVPWCGLAVASWLEDAGFKIPKDLALQIDYIPQLVKFATNKQHRLSLIHKDRVRKGDLVAYDFPTPDGVADHVGLFIRWVDKKAGIFEAVEGNTAVGNDASGGRVMVRSRSMSNVQVFVRKLPV